MEKIITFNILMVYFLPIQKTYVFVVCHVPVEEHRHSEE
jgi:hypothetical protein